MGSDGALWFTDSNLNKIGQLTQPAGVITEFSIPTSNANLCWITAGPDGALWFTEHVVIRPILLASNSMNHRFPSGPTVIRDRPAPGVGTGYSLVTIPAVVIRPI